MSSRVRYPRTFHLPGSPGMTRDDRRLTDEAVTVLDSSDLVITEKMDGGNITLMSDCFYARSTDSTSLPWETAAKAVWAGVAHDIPPGWRVSAESMWARRSIEYGNLPGPVLVFGVWDDEGALLSWTDTEAWAGMLGLPTVPVVGRAYGLSEVRRMWENHVLAAHPGSPVTEVSEGYVVRDAGLIPAGEFGLRVGKWVREGHVRTDADWRHRDDFETNGFG